MFVPLLICLLIVGLASNIISVIMKIRVNEQRVEGPRLSWWSRDFRAVTRTYREYYPNSILPDAERYVSYVVYALFVAVVLTGTLSKE
jgi:hypothetical protein